MMGIRSVVMCVERDDAVIRQIQNMLDMSLRGFGRIPKRGTERRARIMIAQHRDHGNRAGRDDARKKIVLFRVPRMGQVPHQDHGHRVWVIAHGLIKGGAKSRDRIKPDDGFAACAKVNVRQHEDFCIKSVPVRGNGIG